MLPVLKNYNLVDHFFGNDFLDNIFNSNFSAVNVNVPAVNIVETKENFRIEIAAPGLEKGDYKIELHNDLLTISSEKKSEHEEKNEKFMRKEFSYASFKRSFIIPDSANVDSINASYKNGILNVTIPKKEEAKEKATRQISIN